MLGFFFFFYVIFFWGGWLVAGLGFVLLVGVFLGGNVVVARHGV